MAIAKINLTEGLGSTSAAWTVLRTLDTDPVSITDVNGNETGWTIRYVPGHLANGSDANGFNGVGTGAAAWVDEAAASYDGVFYSKFTNDYVEMIVEGPDELTIRMFGSYESSTNNPDALYSVNGGTEQVINTYDFENNQGNSTESAEFLNVQKNANGQFSIIVDRGPSGDRGYVNALYLEGEPNPSMVLNDTIQYGETFTGSYINFTGVPPTENNVILNDGVRTVTETVTVTDNADGSGTFTGTMPSLPPAGESLPAGSLVFPGSINVTLTDPGA